MVNKHSWNHWHHGPSGWNAAWWGLGGLGLGLGLWPLGAWGWGWNWAWNNGVWWWGGAPWWWWNTYNPTYFAQTVYPAYVANYQDVSGDQIPNYWDIENQTTNQITVNAKSGDQNVIIQVGETKRVFHTPGNNQFTVITSTGATEHNKPDTKVVIQNSPSVNVPAAQQDDAMDIEEPMDDQE
jgi:hypothetical protein